MRRATTPRGSLRCALAGGTGDASPRHARRAPGVEPGTTLARRPVRPRQAATVILLRGGDEKLEVLLVQAHAEGRFMGGVWVFPGGAVDDGRGRR